jgi:hypothetical protein
MKKSIFFLQVISIVGMVVSMVVMFNAISNDAIIKAVTTFMAFGGVAVVAIILDERLKKV